MKKLNSFLPVLLLATIALAQPQAPDTLWTRTFGGGGDDWGESVQQTSDGGFIIAGGTYSYVAGFDVYLIKTDGQGNQQWYKTFGGGNNDEGRSVQQTSDGGFIIAGTTSSYGAGSGDVYLIKTDASGNQQWNRTFGGGNYDEGNSVQQTSDGGFIIAGGTSSFGAGFDVYLIKTDASGNQQWYRTFGGSDNDRGESVQQTNDGGFIIAGGTYSYGAGGGDVYLIKTDASGNQQWYRTFGGSDYDCGHCVQQTSDGGFIITERTDSYGAGGADVYLIKTDGQGNLQWYRTFGGSDDDYGHCVQQTSDGGFIIAGRTYSYGAGQDDVYLIKTDGQGNQQWYRTFGGGDHDRGYSVQQTSDGGFIIAGETFSYGAGGSDVYLIRLGAETSVEDNTFNLLPLAFSLECYPNPFNASTTISFNLPSTNGVKLAVFDITGKEITTLDTGHLTLGRNSVVWDASGQGSGIYFVRLQAGDYEQTQKVVLLK